MSMSMKRLLALVGVGLIVLGTMAAVFAVSGPSPGLPVSRTGAATSLRAHGSGIVGVELIPGNFPAWNGVQPVAVAYDSGKGEVFVTNQDSDTVSVISDATNAVVATIPVGFLPTGLAYDSGKGEVFVTNGASNTVSVISDATNAVVASIPVGSLPNGLVYDSGKGEVFVANGVSNDVSVTNNVSVISDATNVVVATIPVGSAVVVIPDGFQSLWVVYVGVASVAAVAVIVGVLLWRRRRARQLPPPQLPPPPP